ncbi:MAG: zinc-binding alcohol dehydrogenase family protein [Candidatus Nanopelagicales bacterium]|nr:zinc-binding alcohol dehydrogenase family protein [Candidatus Nanopelagicales bacterium]
MRAVTMTGIDQIAAGNRPDPQAGADGVLIRVLACAVCRTDLQILRGDLPTHRLPLIPGHQVVGEVLTPGPLQGKRVGLVWLAQACGVCRRCRQGQENLCDHARFTGWDRDGGYAELVTAHKDFVHVLPEGDPVDLAPLLCGGVIGYRSLRIAGIGPQSAGMRLGLYGFGASATIALQIARHWGVQTFVVTRSAAEVDRALELGAAWAGTYDQPLPDLLDAAVTFAPSGDVVVAALRALDKGATVAINAIHLDRIPQFDYDDLWWERSLRSVANVTRADVSEFLALVGPAGVRTQTEVLPRDDAPRALERVETGDVRGAFVLV